MLLTILVPVCTSCCADKDEVHLLVSSASSTHSLKHSQTQ